MKTRILKIKFESLDSFAERTTKQLVEALRTNKQFLQKEDERTWSSVEAYQAFMSDQKYAILAVINKYNPSSVYELAKLLNRPHQNVSRDCKLLDGHGFIKFKKSKTGRKSKMPQLAFSYDSILICLPQCSYAIQLKPAA